MNGILNRLIRMMKTPRFILGALLFGASLFFPVAASAAYGTQEPPRILNLWFDWQLPEESLAELAKWDIVVLDMDQQVRYPDRLRRLKALNPNIKLLAYISASNIAAARFVEEPNFPGYKLAHAIPESWYIHRGRERVGFWVGAWLLNITDESPKDGAGKKWQDYLPEFIEKDVWSTGLWDGIFLDDAIAGPTYFVGSGLDITGDGQAESDERVNASWFTGWERMAKNLRGRLGGNALIMGNGSKVYAPVTNGILLENFPRYGWKEGLGDYQSTIAKNVRPTITALNSNTNNINNPVDFRAMRFGLGSAMLGDGYFSFDFGDKDHGQLWWYDEYDAKLGKALRAPVLLQPKGAQGIVPGVWWRDYEKGAVIVNSAHENKAVDLPGVYERLRGIQDTTVNSGSLHTSLNLAPEDALLLYRRTDSTSLARSTAYRNGSFVRVYDAEGRQIRSAFFVSRSDIPGGAIVLLEDLDRDGRVDVAWSKDGVIHISFDAGGSRSFRPFGSSYTGDLHIAAGNMDRDEPFEIIVSRSGSAQVRTLELDGKVRHTWNAYSPAFKGGSYPAVGNLDGDDKREIITGAGPTGGPHIRMFKTDGALWSGAGFFAYDKRERGGASVAVGDVNKDGKDEIIVGSGQGSIPRIRIFSYKGELIREFTLDRTPTALGVGISLSDIDGDGTLEILASGINPTP